MHVYTYILTLHLNDYQYNDSLMEHCYYYINILTSLTVIFFFSKKMIYISLVLICCHFHRFIVGADENSFDLKSLKCHSICTWTAILLQNCIFFLLQVRKIANVRKSFLILI